MQLDLKTIEALAPDQASLGAAAKLTKRSNWPRLETNDQLGLIWGECQGSGSNPYRVMFDTGDHGYKCTCPSRKFPCKHILALAWICATAPTSFARVDQTPDWVNDWLGRRRKPG
ncbi:MAG: SWIM zinc finger family protein, partial [Mesorhizobium sp.]